MGTLLDKQNLSQGLNIHVSAIIKTPFSLSFTIAAIDTFLLIQEFFNLELGERIKLQPEGKSIRPSKKLRTKTAHVCATCTCRIQEYASEYVQVEKMCLPKEQSKTILHMIISRSTAWPFIPEEKKGMSSM